MLAKVTPAPVDMLIAHCATLTGDADALHVGFTRLAWDLDVAMAMDDGARERYAAIYGREWAANCDGYSNHESASTVAGTIANR